MKKVWITKDNRRELVVEKAANIAVHSFGWAYEVELPKPGEIGTRTTRKPPAEIPIPLKKPEYPGDEGRVIKPPEPSSPVPAATPPSVEQKLHKTPVRSRSIKKTKK